MTSPAATLVLVLAAALAGWAVGHAYFAALRASVDGYLNDRGVFRPVALTVGRYAGALVYFAAVAPLGVWPLLAALLGFTLARLRAVRRIA